MPIKFRCSCGQHYSATETMAGKTAKCRKCGATVKIPELVETPVLSSNSLDDLLDDSDWDAIRSAPAAADDAISTCPSCKADMPRNAVLCVSCGYHQTLGRKVEAAVESKSPSPQTKGVQGFLNKHLAEGESAKSIFGVLGIGAAFFAALALVVLIPALLIPLIVLGVIALLVFISSRRGHGYGGYGGGCSGGHHSSCSGGWFSSCGGGDGGGDGGGGCGGGCGGCGGGGGE